MKKFLILIFLFIFSIKLFAKQVSSDEIYKNYIKDSIELAIESDEDRNKYIPFSEKLKILLEDLKLYLKGEDDEPKFIVYAKGKGSSRTANLRGRVIYWSKKKQGWYADNNIIPGESYYVLHDPERLQSVSRNKKCEGEIIESRYHKIRLGFNDFIPSRPTAEGLKFQKVVKDTTYVEEKELLNSGEEKIKKQIFNFPKIYIPKTFKNEKVKQLIISFRTMGANSWLNASAIGNVGRDDSDPLATAFCLPAKGYSVEETCGNSPVDYSR